MVDAWPATLPQNFQINGYSEGFADNLLETPPDSGPPQSRPRATSAPRPVSGSMQFRQAQLDELRTFVAVTLRQGALPFTFPGATQDETWLVKFPKGGLPKVSVLGPDNYLVTFNLVILP